jgi:hypothetical protein
VWCRNLLMRTTLRMPQALVPMRYPKPNWSGTSSTSGVNKYLIMLGLALGRGFEPATIHIR